MTDAPPIGRFAVHTQTIRPWPLERCCAAYASAGFGGLSVWRHAVAPHGAEGARRIIGDHGLTVPALVRAGFFVSASAATRAAARDENLRALEEAAAIDAGMIVLVVGAEPGVPLDAARGQVEDGLAALLEPADAAGVDLAIEPLHPMYAADKSCINRTRDARELCERLAHRRLGVALDVYHTWWDPELPDEVGRLGAAGLLRAFHVCDWLAETKDLLTDRGLMGEGCIDVRGVRRLVERAGFRGPIEVEVFSERHWARDQDEYVRDIASACLEHC